MQFESKSRGCDPSVTNFLRLTRESRARERDSDSMRYTRENAQHVIHNYAPQNNLTLVLKKNEEKEEN